MVELPQDPAVLVLLVATDGEAWLPNVVAGLRAQEHDALEVIAVDNASTDRSGAILAKAFGRANVITLERRVGYGRALAAALTVAAERRTIADAILLVHDDAELAPGAITALLETMRLPGAGIVGAKLVEWSDPSLLQDIGNTSDRYGRAVPRVERGELDQGQHDGVHEVLYASSAVLMIARDALEEVGLFDLRYVALRDDFDLCWRARLAGYRTFVTTDAVARHASAGVRGLREGSVAKRLRYFSDRNMITTLIKNYGAARLALTLPVTLLISVFNVAFFFVTGRRRAALQTLEALQWNITHLPSTLRVRHRAQKARRVSDAEITAFMHHGATRLRAQFERALELVVGDIDEGPEDERDRPPPRLAERLRRHPNAVIVLVAIVLGALGARTMLFAAHMAGLDLAPFPADAGALFAEYFSGWRGAGAGGAAPATPGLLILGVVSWLAFGSTWLAERLFVLGLPVIGALLMYRLARATGLPPAGRRFAAIAYLLSPLLLGAFGAGRFGDLVLLAAAPGLVLSLLRIGGVLPMTWRDLGFAVIGLALTASLAPWALALFFGGGVVAAIAARSRRAALAALAVIVIALALLFPWSVELFRVGSPIGAGGPDAPSSMRALIGLSPGWVRPIPEPLWYGLAAAAVAGAIVASEGRRRAASVLAFLGVAGLAFAWAVARGVPWIAPRPALPLAATAVAVVLLAAFAFDAAGPMLSRRQAGLGHVAAVILALAVLAQLGAAAVWVASGRHPGIGAADELLPSFLAEEARREGDFRIVWVDGSADAPVVALTGAEGRTMRSYLARPSGSGTTALVRTIAAIAGGSQAAGGRALATLGVRYVIVRPGTHPSMSDALARQVDLRFSQRFQGATVFRNEAGLPIASIVPLDDATWAAIRGTSTDAAAAVPALRPRPMRRTGTTTFVGAAPEGGGAVLLAQDHSTAWAATVDGKPAVGTRAFGWATAFRLEEGQRVTVSWRGQRWHRAALALQGVILLLFMTEWSRRAAHDRGER